MKSLSLRTLITFSVLSLGLTSFLPAQAVEVFFERDQKVPLVYVSVAFRAGATQDPEKLQGISQFTTELMLRGTKSRSRERLDLDLDQMGAHLAVEVRAEYLVFQGAVLSRELNGFLELLMEVLTQPAFSEGEIQKLKSELKSGLLDEQSKDARVAAKQFARFFFDGHPYGWAINGTQTSLSRIKKPDILAQYEKIIQSNHAVVIGSGDAEQVIFEKWASEFGQLRNGGSAITQLTKPSLTKSRRLLLIDKPERTQSRILIGQLGGKMQDPNYYSLTLANQAIGGGTLGRFYFEIREKRGWSYGAYSSFRYGSQPRYWIMNYEPATKDTLSSLKFSLELIEEIKKNGITEAEFQQAKQTLINNAGFAYNTPQKRVDNRLLEKMLSLPNDFFKDTSSHLTPLTREAVNKELAAFLTPDTLAIGVLGSLKDQSDELIKAARVDPKNAYIQSYLDEDQKPKNLTSGSKSKPN